MGNKLTCTAFSPILNRWLVMPPLTCLPSRAKDVVAGDGGLLCFRDMDASGRATPVVCNPVTQQCKELPSMLVMSRPQIGSAWIFTHMVVNKCTGSYQVIVALYDHKMRAYAEFYDSQRDSWTTERSMPLYKLRVFFNPQNGAFCNNILYCVATEKAIVEDKDEEELYSRGLVIYDFSGNWMALPECKTKKGPLHLTNAHVVECLGAVFMVVGEKDDYTMAPSVVVHRLDATTGKRIEVGKLLDTSSAQGWKPGYQLRTYNCVGQGDQICLLDVTSFQVLVFSITHGTWAWLPSSPFTGVRNFHHSSLPNVCRGRRRRLPTAILLSEAGFQPNAHVFV